MTCRVEDRGYLAKTSESSLSALYLVRHCAMLFVASGMTRLKRPPIGFEGTRQTILRIACLEDPVERLRAA